MGNSKHGLPRSYRTYLDKPYWAKVVSESVYVRSHILGLVRGTLFATKNHADNHFLVCAVLRKKSSIGNRGYKKRGWAWGYATGNVHLSGWVPMMSLVRTGKKVPDKLPTSRHPRMLHHELGIAYRSSKTKQRLIKIYELRMAMYRALTGRAVNRASKRRMGPTRARELEELLPGLRKARKRTGLPDLVKEYDALRRERDSLDALGAARKPKIPGFNAKVDAYHEKLRKARNDPRVKRYIDGVESYNREINLTASVSAPKPSDPKRLAAPSRPLPRPWPASYTTRVKLKNDEKSLTIYRNCDRGRTLKDPVQLASRSDGKLGWRYNFFMPGRKRVVRHCVVFASANTESGREPVFGFIHVNQIVKGQRPWKGAYVK